MIVAAVGEFRAGVYDVVQVPDASVQEAGLNVPPALPLVHDIVPFGVIGKLVVSATCTTNETELPVDTVA